MYRRLAAALAATLAAAAVAFAAPGAAAQQACPLKPVGSAQVASVRDGRTLELADGRELRLAAVEVTAASLPVLQSLVAGRALRLEALGPDHDRYGRLVAFAFAGEARQSVQQALLAAGAARVAARVGDRPCAERLLKAERAARRERRGLWADPNFAPVAADNRVRLAAEKGHFALVEGQVLSVHPSGATLYLNFGRRWTKDFSVAILRRNRRKFAAAGIAPLALKGRHIRVRGVVEWRAGPLIEADAPEQIELIE